MANTSPAPPFKVRALFDYNSPHDDDLNFPANETITVTEEEDADWYFGEYHEKSTGELKQGIFPRNFVERIVVELPPRPARSGGGRKKVQEEPPPEPAGDAREESQVPSAPPAPVVVPAALPSPATSPIATTKPVGGSEPPPRREEPKVVPPPIPASPPPVPKPAPVFAPKQSVPPVVEKAAPSSSKPPPPEKPSSFKDRLALFNKGSAAPIAPFNPHKPSTSFIKKPFVPPPPSKNAYVPPPIQHTPKPRRDEDSNYIRPEPEEPPARASMDQERDRAEERPQMGLKDRIALLQTQKLDPTGLGGGKPKKPPKPKRNDSERTLEEGKATHAPSEDVGDERVSHDSTRPVLSEEPETASRHKKSIDLIQDDPTQGESSAGDADVSSVSGYTGEETVTSRGRPSTSSHREDKSDDGDDEGANDDTPDNPDSDEEEIDPELAKKIALRDRIAKMSGGMGMHGMFGPPMGVPMGGPPMPTQKKKKSASNPKPQKEADESLRSWNDGDESENKGSSDYAQAPPVALPFATPRVRSPPAIEQSEPGDGDGEPARGTAGAGTEVSMDHPKDEAVDMRDTMSQSPQQITQPHPQGPRPMPGSPVLEKKSSQVPPPPVPRGESSCSLVDDSVF